MKKISARAYFFKKMIDWFFVGLFIVFLLLMWTLYKGPISVPYLKPYIVQALNYDENDYKIEIGDVNIELVRSIQPLRVTAKNVAVTKKDNTMSMEAPKLYMSFSLRALLKGIIAPSDIALINPKAYILASYGVEKEIQAEDGNRKKLQFYVEQFNKFLNEYNSEDKIYPESYINNVKITGGDLVFDEVDYGRQWILSDITSEFNRKLINMEIDASALVNINDKIASVGIESEYHANDDKLDLEVYFSDLVISDFVSTFNETTEDNIFSMMSIEVPVNGKVSTTLKLTDILRHPSEVKDYIGSAVEKIIFELDGGHGYVAFNGDDKYNYDIDELQLEGEVVGGIDEIHINDAELKMGGQHAVIDLDINGLESFYFTQTLQDTAMSIKVKVDEFPLAELSRFWPRYIAEPAWEWCKDGLIDGNAQNADFRFDFGYRPQSDDWGLTSLKGTGQLNDVDVFYLEGMPVVHDVYGTAHFSKRNILIDVDKGVSNGVIITGGKVDIYDLDKEDNFISIKLVGNSSVSDALKLIDNKPLEFTSAMGLDPDTIEGNVDVKLGLDFELRQDLDTKDIKVDVTADLHNVAMNKLLPPHKISSENMDLKVTSKGWNLTGKGNFDDIPVSFAMNENFDDKKYKSRSHISFTLDEKTQKQLGINLKILQAPYLQGTSLVNADVIVGENGLIDVNLSADLRNTKMDYAFLGMVKEVGEAAEIKAKIKMKGDKVTAVSNMSLVKSGFTVNGNMAMHGSGRIRTIDVSDIKSPRTSARAKINLTDSDNPSFKIEVAGDSYDLRTLFDKIDDKSDEKNDVTPSQENEDDGLETVNNTDISITVNHLWTNDTTPIQNFTGSAKLRHGIGIDELSMVGNFGVDKSIKLNLSYMPRANKEHFLSVESNNAGGTLKVLRLYDNMVGGTLKLEARREADKKFIGHAMVRDFSIQNAPVVAKILSVASFAGMLDLLKGDGLTFTHFSAPFEYQYKILKLKHAKAEGNVVGLTAIGQYNRATDNVNLHGVIAPAYSLNRFLGKIPVVGNLLASKDGTIFAANYKAEGKAKDVKVDVNSLSMLSPNSMKEWYNKNFGDEEEL